MRNPIEIILDKFKKEAYTYFDQNIHKLSKTKAGEFDESGGAMQNNDADAFRHAYASGSVTQWASAYVAEKLGQIVEWKGNNPKNQKIDTSPPLIVNYCAIFAINYSDNKQKRER